MAVIGSSRVKKPAACVQDTKGAAVRCCADASVTTPCKLSPGPPVSYPKASSSGTGAHHNSRKCGGTSSNPWAPPPPPCPRGQSCINKVCRKKHVTRKCGKSSNPWAPPPPPCPRGMQCVRNMCKSGHSSNSWRKVANRYCGASQDFNKKYKTAAAAMSACQANSQCKAISDAGCDGKDYFVTCSSATGQRSRSHSCLMRKP